MHKLIPEEILKIIPIRYQFIDKLSSKDGRIGKPSRKIKNNYYNSEKTICLNNYRKTSKLLNEEDSE